MKPTRSLWALALVGLLQACAADNTDLVLRPSPEFAPVYPLAADRDKIATGGIYIGWTVFAGLCVVYQRKAKGK